MKNLKGCYSHKSDEWKTPLSIYEIFEDQGFFDPCPINHKKDGLKIDWGNKAFVNPPYSQIDKWVDKAIEEMKKGCWVWLLVPARTDTKWFKKLYDANCGISLIKGRLHFNESKQGAPFPSALIILSKEYLEPWIGKYWNED